MTDRKAQKKTGEEARRHLVTARDAGRIARLAEAKRLIVGHFSSRYLNEQPILDEAKAEFPDTILAREMLSIDI